MREVLSGVGESSWERERLLESLDAYRRGLSDAPLLRKWNGGGLAAGVAGGRLGMDGRDGGAAAGRMESAGGRFGMGSREGGAAAGGMESAGGRFGVDGRDGGTAAAGGMESAGGRLGVDGRAGGAAAAGRMESDGGRLGVDGRAGGPAAAGGSGAMTFVISGEEVDRHGDVVSAAGWHLAAYRQNPVFLWAHDYTRPVIGRAAAVWPEPGLLLARMEFAPTDFAAEVAALYRSGYQQGVSVGFKPLRYEERRQEQTGAFLGIRFLEQELLEVSAVPVPANRQALRRALEQAPRVGDYLCRASGWSPLSAHPELAALSAHPELVEGCPPPLSAHPEPAALSAYPELAARQAALSAHPELVEGWPAADGVSPGLAAALAAIRPKR